MTSTFGARGVGRESSESVNDLSEVLVSNTKWQGSSTMVWKRTNHIGIRSNVFAGVDLWTPFISRSIFAKERSLKICKVQSRT